MAVDGRVEAAARALYEWSVEREAPVWGDDPWQGTARWEDFEDDGCREGWRLQAAAALAAADYADRAWAGVVLAAADAADRGCRGHAMNDVSAKDREAVEALIAQAVIDDLGEGHPYADDAYPLARAVFDTLAEGGDD